MKENPDINRAKTFSTLPAYAILLELLLLPGLQAETIAEPYDQIEKVPPEPVSFWTEAESFENLATHPVFSTAPGQGWYVKEHRFACQRAFAVCDEQSEGASMIKRLGKDYPPGLYHLIPRIVLMRFSPRLADAGYGQKNGNWFRLEAGQWQEGGFKTLATQDFEGFNGSGYSHLRHSDLVEIPGPWNALRVTALDILAAGIGDIPEHPLATILLDQIGITNMPGTQWTGSHSGRMGAILPPLLSEERVTPPIVESSPFSPPPPSRLPELPLPSGNVLTNGSFESGVRPDWAPKMWGDLGNTLNFEDLQKGGAKHGKWYLVLRPWLSAHSDQEWELDQKGEKPLPRRQIIWHRPVRVLAGEPYRLVFFARANKKGIPWEGQTLDVQTWTRFEKILTSPGNPGKDSEGRPLVSHLPIEFSFETTDPHARIHLDAVSLTLRREGEPTGYESGGWNEVTVSTRQPYATFYNSSSIQLMAAAYHGKTDLPFHPVLNWSIYDAIGTLMEQGRTPLQVFPGSVAETPIPLHMRSLGVYGFSYTVEDLSSQPPLVTPFGVVQNPRQIKGKKPFIGAYGNFADEGIPKTLAHYGWDWVTDLSDVHLRHGGGAYRDNDGQIHWRTFRHMKAMFPQHGIEWTGEITGAEKPPWDPGVIGTRAAPGAGRPYYSLPLWRETIENLMRIYRGMAPFWILNDETENQRAPQDVAPFFWEGYKAVKKVAPEVKVMWSLDDQTFLKCSEILGATRWIDVFGGSRFGLGSWKYRRDRRITDGYGLPTWHIGVGWPGVNDVDLFDDRGRPRGEIGAQHFSQWAFDFAMQTACVEPDRYCPYTVKYYSRISDPYNHIGPDGRLKTNGIIYTIICQFLRDASRGDILVPQKTSLVEGCVFSKPDGNYAALRLRSPPIEKQLFLGLSPSKLEAFDYFLRPLEVRPAPLNGNGKNQIAQVALTQGSCLFLKWKKGKKEREQFVQALQDMAGFESLAFRHLVTVTSHGFEYVLAIQNNGEKLLTGSAVFTGLLKDPAAPAESSFSLLPGSWTSCHFPLQKDLLSPRPLTQFPVQAHLRIHGPSEATGKQSKPQQGSSFPPGKPLLPISGELWTHYATRIREEEDIRLDGSLEDYPASQSAAWVFIDWTLGGGYGFSQGRLGVDACDGLDDLSLSARVRWKPQELLFAGRMQDDRLVSASNPEENDPPGDRILFRIDTAVLGDPFAKAKEKTYFEVIVGPALGLRKAFVFKNQRLVTTLPLSIQLYPKYWQFEFVLPAGVLEQEAFKAHQTFGLDITVQDADREDRGLETEAGWAGAFYVPSDVRGFGQLLLLE